MITFKVNTIKKTFNYVMNCGEIWEIDPDYLKFIWTEKNKILILPKEDILSIEQD